MKNRSFVLGAGLGVLAVFLVLLLSGSWGGGGMMTWWPGHNPILGWWLIILGAFLVALATWMVQNLNKEKKLLTKTCPECGTIVLADWDICPICQKPLE